MKISNRSQVKSFIVMDIMRDAYLLEKQGKSIIHMEVGQPSTGAAPEAIKKLKKDISSDSVGYTVALGIPELKERISRHYQLKYNLKIDQERIVVTSGASAAFILAFTAFFDPGDKVLIGEPCYPSYKNILNALGLETQFVSTSSQSRFQLTSQDLLKSDSKGVLVASPSNPTGTSLTGEELFELTNISSKKNMVFISDEIYHGISFNHDERSALEFNDNNIVINSFSKYFCLSGWRIGWMIVPRDKIRTIERLAQNLFICASHASQLLALHSFNSKKVLDEQVAAYKVNRKILLDALPRLGFSDIVEPDGAFYIYANIGKFRIDSRVFVKKILNEAGVAVTPGHDFDCLRGGQTVRFSFSCSSSDCREAVRRLTKWYKKIETF